MAGKKRRRRQAPARPVRVDRAQGSDRDSEGSPDPGGTGARAGGDGSDGGRTDPRRDARTDGALAAAVGVGAMGLFASTFSSRVALGDAPEYVSGVKVLGVLHAPGYPAYVLFSRGFSSLIPIGGLAFRVNLFSLVCAALMVAAVFLIAREFGASRGGSVIAVLGLASAASVWFYAGFAKHYAFSGLLVAAALLLVLWWQRGGRPWMLLIAAAALGIGMGAAQELAIIMAVGLAVLIATGPRRIAARWVAACLLTILALTVAGWVFIVWRAHQHPAVDWGDATSAQRLFALVTHRDFRASGADAPTSWSSLSKVPGRLVAYLGIVARDLGLAACALAIIGAVVAFSRRLSRDRKLFLGIVFGLNLLAVVTISVVDSISGFLTGMVAGGYLVDLYIVLAVLMALGAGATIDAVAGWGQPSAVRSARGRPAPGAARTWVRPVVAVVLASVVIVPSLVVHYEYANHRIPDFADRYARRVLRAVPHRGVLVSSQADWAFPFEYRQIVEHERPDVSVVDADSMGLDWYQQRLTRELGVPASTFGRSSVLDQAVRALRVLHRTRPVVLDTGATALFAPKIGYRSNGLVASMVDGKPGPRGGAGLARRAASLQAADRAVQIADHTYLHFPNIPVHYFYARAHIELAKQLVMARDPAGAERELARALEIYPYDPATRYVLQNLRNGADGAQDLVGQL